MTNMRLSVVNLLRRNNDAMSSILPKTGSGHGLLPDNTK